MLYTKAQYELDLHEIELDSQALSCAVANGKITGFQCLKISAGMELAKRKLKGKLLATVSILKDGDKKSSCLQPKAHSMGCKCKRLYKFQQAEKEQNEHDQV